MKRIATLKKTICCFQRKRDSYPEGRGGGGSGVGASPYIIHTGTCMCHPPPQRVWFLRRLSLKTGPDFAHFGLESGMVFLETTGVYELIYRFNSK